MIIHRHKKGSKVTQMAQLFDDTIRTTTKKKQVTTRKAASHSNRNSHAKNQNILNNKHNDKETRRKMMLQERRMEKALSFKSIDCIVEGVTEKSVSDYAGVTECHEETKVPKSHGSNRDVIKFERIVPSLGVTTASGTNRWTIFSRVLLVSLTFYQVQLHCSTTAWILSSVTSYIQDSIEHFMPLVDSTFGLSGNFLMLRLICDLHEKAMFGLDGRMSSISWEEVVHIIFVGTLIIRGLVVSYGWMIRYRRTTGAMWLKCTLLFLLSTVFWSTILPLYSKCNSGSSKYCIFTATKVISSPRYSWLDVMVVKFYKSSSILLKTKIKGRLFKEAQRAFVNPFRFHGRLKKLFTIIRWAKFLAPLIGTCNKLRGHILDMMKKKGQHLTSKSARKMWSDLMEALTSQSKQERAVLQIQKSFREMREHKAKRRMELISSDRPSARHIRQQLRAERNLSKSKLIKMEMLDSERQLRRQVSEQEKESILKHKESRKREKKRLLLSPKTTFALGWKYMAISCVILEVSQMIFAPLLSGELKKMPLDQFLSALLFASYNKKKAKGFCFASPWKHKWLMTVHLFSRCLTAFVHAVCFLDVFVTFSTGELTSTGKLVPKPFFTRYILPGIGLQLIVNPTMVALSEVVKTVILHSINVGPSLCFHLMLVCLPFVHWIYDMLLEFVIDFVERQNKIISSRTLNIF